MLKHNLRHRRRCQLHARREYQHGGRITLGFGLTASAPQGVIYYTTDGSDPRTALTGEPSPTAQVFDGPLALDESTHVKTRALSGGRWSALDEATFLVRPPALAISEIHFNPAAPSPAVIEAGRYLVFDQSQHFGNPAAEGVSEPFGFSELGGRAILSAADARGLLGYRTSRQFGAAEREVSFGLHVKSSR